MADDLVKLIALLRKLDAAATPGPWEADGRHVVTSNELGWITGHVADADEQDVDLIVVARNHLTRLLAAADRIETLEKALQQLADNKLSDDNCASVELAGRRVAALARRALEAK